MSIKNPAAKNCIATTDAQHTNESTISGPHPAFDETGQYYEFYACESCGLESTDRRLQDGCPRCGGV